MTVWFTSDLHINHANIIKYCDRPFKDVEEMNYALLDNWNSVVDDNDTVYFLGDWSMGNQDEGLAWVSLFKGIKIILPGNHDKCFRAHKGYEKWRTRFQYAGFEAVLTSHGMSFLNDIMLSHFPYLCPGDDKRFSEYRLENKGQWLLHGHTHGKWKIKDKMVDVGVDVWDYTPVSLDTLQQLMKDNK